MYYPTCDIEIDDPHRRLCPTCGAILLTACEEEVVAGRKEKTRQMPGFLRVVAIMLTILGTFYSVNMQKNIAIINQKGEVGKTTTPINLACGLALQDKKALFIDLDPQAHSTSGLIDPENIKFGIQNV